MIYLDNNATSRPSPGVVEAMLPYLTECYFNPSSSTAAFTGADKPRQAAAVAMARLLNAEDPDCFVFTSGATEANNWAFFSLLNGGDRGRVVISAIEHPSVSEPALALSAHGFDVIEVPVDRNGVLDQDALIDALGREPMLVSIMAANNETGVLQRVDRIGELIREHAPSALFHTDATQAVGKIPVDLQRSWPEVDLLSFSAHKFHGPKGVGGLYIRPGIDVAPLLLGGGQERGLRSGTTNTAGLAGLAAAANEAAPAHFIGTTQLRDEFESNLSENFPGATIHSHSAARLPNTSCFSLRDIRAADLAERLATQGIIIGTGSACSSRALHPPKTLIRMGIGQAAAWAALRLSISLQTTAVELSSTIRALEAAVTINRA
jgi:cysteine desulfurase